MVRKVTPEVAQQLDARIRELEACLAKAFGFVAHGPASEYAREHMLAEMRKVLNWPTPNVGAMIAELERFANQQ